jgi:hypothetical protein
VAKLRKLFTNERRNEQGPHLYDVNYGTAADLSLRSLSESGEPKSKQRQHNAKEVSLLDVRLARYKQQRKSCLMRQLTWVLIVIHLYMLEDMH